ncbi:MAG: preprotein translocase subunit YajC [Chthoniobacterales bacterium]
MHLTDILLFAQAAAATPTPPPPLAQMIQGVGLPVIFIVIFYFLLIRPQMKKQKEHQKLVSSLQTGDTVITSGGIHGVITNVKDRTVIVRIADNVKVEFDRSAVSAVTRDTEKAA